MTDRCHTCGQRRPCPWDPAADAPRYRKLLAHFVVKAIDLTGIVAIFFAASRCAELESSGTVLVACAIVMAVWVWFGEGVGRRIVRRCGLMGDDD